MMNVAQTHYYNMLKNLAQEIGAARELVEDITTPNYDEKRAAILSLCAIEKMLYDSVTDAMEEEDGDSCPS